MRTYTYFYWIATKKNYWHTFNEKRVICLNGDRRRFGERVNNQIKRSCLNESVRIKRNKQKRLTKRMMKAKDLSFQDLWVPIQR